MKRKEKEKGRNSHVWPSALVICWRSVIYDQKKKNLDFCDTNNDNYNNNNNNNCWTTTTAKTTKKKKEEKKERKRQSEGNAIFMPKFQQLARLWWHWPAREWIRMKWANSVCVDVYSWETNLFLKSSLLFSAQEQVASSIELEFRRIDKVMTTLGNVVVGEFFKKHLCVCVCVCMCLRWRKTHFRRKTHFLHECF